MTRRKQTVQAECFMNERQPNSLGHEDHSEWQRRKTRLQWLMWPSTQRIGKVIRASSYFSTRRVVDLVPEACSTAMTEDRHDELAAIDLSMIVVALTPSWLVWISTVMPSYIFHHSCFFMFCFWTRNFIYYTSASCVWFLLPYVNLQSNWAWKPLKLGLSILFRLCSRHSNVNYCTWHFCRSLLACSEISLSIYERKARKKCRKRSDTVQFGRWRESFSSVLCSIHS